MFVQICICIEILLRNLPVTLVIIPEVAPNESRDHPLNKTFLI